MIVGERKPLQEIAGTISGFNRVLILGCGTCVTVCMTGGDKEARTLARDLTRSGEFNHQIPSFEVDTIERQCERDLIETYLVLPDQTDAVLSLACGAGVQTLSGIYSHLPVLPALNTSFLGSLVEPGVWTEQCCGCGDCVLAITGGICPVARCAKRLFNGPCGGSKYGKCEINGEVDCAWSLIIDRLTRLNRLSLIERILPIRDWSADRGGGPRRLTHSSP